MPIKSPLHCRVGRSNASPLSEPSPDNLKMLLLDEPTSALDPLMTVEVLDLILELKNEGMDIVLVTHHMHFAERVGEQVLFIAEGKVLEEGPVEVTIPKPHRPLSQTIYENRFSLLTHDGFS